MIPYLIAEFCSVISNCLCVLFVEKKIILLENGQIIMDVFLHGNLINMFLFFILFSIQKVQGKINFRLTDSFHGCKEFIQFLLFAFPVLASIYKTYLLGFIPVTTITICSMIVPFTVWYLAIFLLKEKFRSSYVKYGILSVFGFIIVNLQKLSGGEWSLGYIQYLIFYIFILSIGQITMRYYCKTRDHSLQAVLAEITIFFLYATIFLIFRGTFSAKMLFNPYVWIVSLCCFLRHVLIINGVRHATSIVALEFCGFSKPIYACILSYILLSEKPTLTKLIGLIVIGIAIVRFHFLERKYKKDKKN